MKLRVGLSGSRTLSETFVPLLLIPAKPLLLTIINCYVRVFGSIRLLLLSFPFSATSRIVNGRDGLMGPPLGLRGIQPSLTRPLHLQSF
jgi:hypothetical protein